MDKKITNFFGGKKRDLSDESKEGDEPKKVKNSSVSELPDEVFDDSMSPSEGFKILFKCLRSVESQVKNIFCMINDTKDNQIKGEKRLQELQDSVDFISKKFDIYEKDRIENEKKIDDLEIKVSNLNDHVMQLQNQLDFQQQYTRRNCVLIHGIEEGKGENTDKLVCDVIKDELDITIDIDKDIDRSHRLGRFKQDKKRPIIVKLVRHNLKHKIYSNKKKLKGKKISITESLTQFRVQNLNQAREEYGYKNVWTIDGRIYFKAKGDDKPKIYYD
mgnify:CR=1 FL=1